jgi:hypothetical protein
MIKVEGNKQCFFVQEPNKRDIQGLRGEIIEDKVKFVFMYKPDNVIKWLFQKEIPFVLNCFGPSANIIIDIEYFEWI